MAFPPDTLFRLVYVSRIAPASEDELDSVLAEILARGQPQNRKLGVTSLLMAHRGWFIQLIEGPEAAVHEALQAIQEDSRHRLLRVMIEGEVEKRLFPDWSLAARLLSAADAAVLRGFDAADWFDPTALPERTLMRLAAVVAKAHGRRFDAQQRVTIRRRTRSAITVQCRP